MAGVAEIREMPIGLRNEIARIRSRLAIDYYILGYECGNTITLQRYSEPRDL